MAQKVLGIVKSADKTAGRIARLPRAVATGRSRAQQSRSLGSRARHPRPVSPPVFLRKYRSLGFTSFIAAVSDWRSQERSAKRSCRMCRPPVPPYLKNAWLTFLEIANRKIGRAHV